MAAPLCSCCKTAALQREIKAASVKGEMIAKFADSFSDETAADKCEEGAVSALNSPQLEACSFAMKL